MLNEMPANSALPALAHDAEGTFDVRIVEPGDDVNLYEFDVSVEEFRLAGVYRTRQAAPFDLAVIPDTAADDQDNLKVLLLSHRASPPGCVVNVRAIGVIELRNQDIRHWAIIAVPTAADTMRRVFSVEDLPSAQRLSLTDYLQAGKWSAVGTPLRWGGADEAGQVVHAARVAARKDRARRRTGSAAIATWKPLGRRVAGAMRASDTEPHTEAELAYQQLPHRFQQYVDEYLTHSERVLFAVHRPAMRSSLRRRWLTSETLQEGILLITDQQVAFMLENLPPDRAGIKYGYTVHTGAPENIDTVAVRKMNRSACLDLGWRAADGQQQVTWEFPAEAFDELQEAAQVVRRWQPIPGSYSLRRASGARPVDVVLRDPKANDPSDVWPVAARLQDAIANELADSERLLAGALLPAWADAEGVAHLLGVTDRRMVFLPDPQGPQRSTRLSWWLKHITTLEIRSSIMGSWLALNLVNGAGLQRVEIAFPYTAEDFKVCFTALRQQMIVVRE